jgi:hypothetical protein
MVKRANPTTLLVVSVLLVGIHCATAACRPIYVDANAPPGGDGSSWATAYRYLQDALADASNGDQIWVAAGTYYPSVEVGGTGDRYKTFQMKDGVAIYGGFPAGGDTFANHDPNQYDMILSCYIGFLHATENVFSDSGFYWISAPQTA